MKIAQIEHVRTELNKLLNRKVVYGLSEFSVIDFKYDSRISKFIISVDDRDEDFELSVDDAVDFVRTCTLLEIGASKTQAIAKPGVQAVPEMLTPNLETTQTLKEILLGNIKKVKQDSAFVPQAQEISKQVGQVINVLRVEMECIRLAQMLNGDGKHTENKQS